MTNASPESLPALGICLEDYEYPYPEIGRASCRERVSPRV